MVATYKLHSTELTTDFLRILQDTFQNKEISLRVEETEDDEDETEYLLSTTANREHLLAGIRAVETGTPYATMTIGEMDALVQ
jgi:hypothetical protein